MAHGNLLARLGAPHAILWHSAAMITVSVLSAACNAAATIARTAHSLLAQTYPHWEWIIASDDGADYEEILLAQGLRDSRIRFTTTGRVRAGAAAARNAALAAAQGEVMAVLDADDVFASTKIERLLPRVLEYGAATCDLVLVESATDRRFPSLNKKYPAGLLTAEQYLTANLHGYSLLLWDRRRVDIQWDQTITFAEDMVHGVCLFNVLPGIYYDAEPLHFYYKHPSSVCNTQAMDRILDSYKALIARVDRDALPVKCPAVRAILLRFLRRLLALEEKFFAEPASDACMGFYHFIASNREAFYSW
jgi:glycosyltransferase involved in cell wall biosynthesis